MITCETCGQILPDGTGFCSNCGAQLNSSPIAQPDSDEISSAMPDMPDTATPDVQPIPEQPSMAAESQPQPETYNPYVMPQQNAQMQNGSYYQQPVQEYGQQPYQNQSAQSTYSQQSYAQPDYGQQLYSQPQYGQPVNSYQQNYYPQQKQTDGKSVVALVMGVISLMSSCAYGAGIIFGIVGIIFAVLSKKERGSSEDGNGLATGGMVCSIVGTILSALFLLMIILVFAIGLYEL